MVGHEIAASSDEQFAKQASKSTAPTPKKERRSGTTFVVIMGFCLRKSRRICVPRAKAWCLNCPLPNRKILLKVVLHFTNQF